MLLVVRIKCTLSIMVVLIQEEEKNANTVFLEELWSVHERGGCGAHARVFFNSNEDIHMLEHVIFSVYFSQMWRTPISVRLSCLHALQLSSYGQIEAMICVLECHVNVVNRAIK